MGQPPLLSGLSQIMAQASAMALAMPPRSSRTKAHQDHVTDVDLRLDAFLQHALGELTPAVPVLSEERACDLTAPVERWWIVDPLDGTGNLVAGLPFVAIAVALVDRDGPLLAAVSAPFQGRAWTAARGAGAWLDGEPLLLGGDPGDLVVVSTGLLDQLRGPESDELWNALRSTGKIRNLGAQALHLCGVASGWFAAALSIEAKIWDEAAGGLVLREAGGVWRSAADSFDWTDPRALMTEGRQNSLACHPGLAETHLSRLAQVFYGSRDG